MLALLGSLPGLRKRGNYRAGRGWIGLVGVLAGTAVCVGSAPGALPNALLPDLDERAPLAVSVRWGGPPGNLHPRLVFTSTVENVGFGPLVVEGRRQSTRVPTMRADQLVRLRSGGFERFGRVGRMRYNVSPSHSHWHLQPFEQYELRTVDGRRLVRDHKSGFCLTNDYRSPLPTLGPRGTQRVDKTDCGRDKPGARHVLEGISVGWGDIYVPAKEASTSTSTAFRTATTSSCTASTSAGSCTRRTTPTTHRRCESGSCRRRRRRTRPG